MENQADLLRFLSPVFVPRGQPIPMKPKSVAMIVKGSAKWDQPSAGSAAEGVAFMTADCVASLPVAANPHVRGLGGFPCAKSLATCSVDISSSAMPADSTTLTFLVCLHIKQNVLDGRTEQSARLMIEASLGLALQH